MREKESCATGELGLRPWFASRTGFKRTLSGRQMEVSIMNARNLMKMLATALVVALMASPMVLAAGPGGGNGGGGGGNRPPTGETTGNNLSFPVIWAEGVAKALRGTQGLVQTQGAYWYQWGTNGEDPDVVPASCPSDPDENPGDGYCDDGVVGTLTIKAGVPVANHPLELSALICRKTPSTPGKLARRMGAPRRLTLTGSTGATILNRSTGIPARRCVPRLYCSRALPNR